MSKQRPVIVFTGDGAMQMNGMAELITIKRFNAVSVKDPDELADVWRSALSADCPTVLDVYTDPDMPPIPPHATWDQFKAATTAVLAGDEDRAGFVKTGIKTKAQEFLPHRKS